MEVEILNNPNFKLEAISSIKRKGKPNMLKERY